MAFPVRTVTEPAVLRGQPNGELPRSILVSTAGQAGGPTVILVEPAARAWRALAAAAKKAGHILKLSGAASGYRTYAEQVRLFEQRFTTTRIAGRPTRKWRGKTWYLRPGMALAAVPGTSNHGRGLAVDTGEERDGDTGTESVDAGTVDWLVKNEERYGFSHEVQSEPWHLRYYAGDRIPAAVLAYERSLKPKPTITIQEIANMAQSVLVKKASVAQVWATNGIHKRAVSAADIPPLLLAGVVSQNGSVPYVLSDAAVDNLRAV